MRLIAYYQDSGPRELAHCLTDTTSGLVVVASSNTNWNLFTLCSIIGYLQDAGCYIENKHLDNTPESSDMYDLRYLCNALSYEEVIRVVHNYGGIRDRESLVAALESAANHVTVAVLNVLNASGVINRCTDMLEHTPFATTMNQNFLEDRIAMIVCLSDDVSE